MQGVVDELTLGHAVRDRINAIRRRVTEIAPDAEFSLHQGDDPAGLYLAVVSDTEDGFEILSRVADELVDALLDDGLALYVVPVHRVPPVPSQQDVLERLLAAAS
jgi:hypothetical protein